MNIPGLIQERNFVIKIHVVQVTKSEEVMKETPTKCLLVLCTPGEPTKMTSE
jgi:hypothetical protein